MTEPTIRAHVVHGQFHRHVEGDGDRAGFNATCSGCDLKVQATVSPAAAAERFLAAVADAHLRQTGADR